MSELPSGTLYCLVGWRGHSEDKIMRALCWHGKGDVRVDTVTDPNTKPLLKRIEAGDIDPSLVVTHPANLEDAPAMYKKFQDKEDGVIKVVAAGSIVQ